MSASDGGSALAVELEGASAAPDPADALREALSAIGRQLGGTGAGPHHMTAMTWTAPDIAAFDLARRNIDLVYREVFAGFRPPIEFVRGEQGRLTVLAHVKPPGPSDPRPVWRGYSAAQLAAQYSARSQVADMRPVFAKWTGDGNAFRRRHEALDIAYGAAPAMQLDLYRPQGATTAPAWVFIHGGYWQSVCREQNAQFAEGLVRAGFAVANLDYGLAPETPIAEMFPQIRAALTFLVRKAGELGIDSNRMAIAGHSAGAQLAAMAVADPACPPLTSALLISGIFDLAPLALLPMGRVLGLTNEATIAANSPTRLKPRSGTRVALALGGKEGDEFKRQSLELSELWRTTTPLIVTDTHHFDVLETLREGTLLDLALRLRD